MRWVRENRNEMDEELMKKAEMSLRNAPTSLHVKVVPPYVQDGKVYHPNLTEKGDLKKKAS